MGAAFDGDIFAGAAFGADGPAASGALVVAGRAVDGETVIYGDYGTLTIQADGTYSYVQTALMSGGAADVFTYTLTDGDGDKKSATLTITAPGSGGGDPVITLGGADDNGDHLVLNEAHLGAGTAPDPGALSKSGGFTVDAHGLLCELDVSLGGQHIPLSFNGDGTLAPGAGGSIQTPNGLLTVSGSELDPATGLITVHYEYTLQNPCHSTGGDDGRNVENESFTITVAGTNISTTLQVDIIDDMPAARSEAQDASGVGAMIHGDILANDSFGADGPAAGGSLSMEAGDFVRRRLQLCADRPDGQGRGGCLRLHADGRRRRQRERVFADRRARDRQRRGRRRGRRRP